MPFRINYSKGYKKREHKFFKKHRDLLSKYEKTLRLLEANPFHPSLRLHKLSGNLEELHSVSLDIQYRITLEFYIEDEEIVPVNIGTHDDVY
jgi:mRNA-degrading endonuclease YafQ of YafQ-DinJ toxin-antitoxin module